MGGTRQFTVQLGKKRKSRSAADAGIDIAQNREVDIRTVLEQARRIDRWGAVAPALSSSEALWQQPGCSEGARVDGSCPTRTAGIAVGSEPASQAKPNLQRQLVWQTKAERVREREREREKWSAARVQRGLVVQRGCSSAVQDRTTG